MVGESRVAQQALAEQGRLIDALAEGLEALAGLRKRVVWGPSEWLPDKEFLDFLDVQRISLGAAGREAMDGLYRESYNTTRMVLEGYLVLILISLCDRYPFTYRVQRSRGDKSLDEAVAKVEQQIRAKAGSELIEMRRVSKGELRVVRRGVPVVDSSGKPTGVTVPFYYSVWQQYRPEEHHLKRPRLKVARYLGRQWAVFGRRVVTPDTRHSEFYDKFFSFEGLVEQLLLNGVLNRKTAARLRVHYNFLSGFAHSTRAAIDHMLRLGYYHGGEDLPVYDHYHSDLCLLYACHLLHMHVDLALRYFRRRRLRVREASMYRSVSRQIASDFGYFWFIFNAPHEYDKFEDANRRSDYRKGIVYRPEDILDRSVRYYDDPLRRLKNLHSSTREFTTGNVFVSPFPRADALR